MKSDETIATISAARCVAQFKRYHRCLIEPSATLIRQRQWTTAPSERVQLTCSQTKITIGTYMLTKKVDLSLCEMTQVLYCISLGLFSPDFPPGLFPPTLMNKVA